MVHKWQWTDKSTLFELRNYKTISKQPETNLSIWKMAAVLSFK